MLPDSFVKQVCRKSKIKFNNSVYNPLVVMWLLMWQRLHGAAPLEAAVLDVLQELPATFWPNPCKRVREWQESGKPMSGNTTAYSKARNRLPSSVVEQCCDRIFEQLTARLSSACAPASGPAFLVDGTTMRMAYSPALAERFPPGSNQHGENHWPIARVVVAHDLQTGLAMRPQWEAMHGEDAASEQRLLESAIDRLPKGATVVGDSNFGIFSIAWTATKKGYPALVRLTKTRADYLAGGPVQDGMDLPVVWKPSRDDRKGHPNLPADASVSGRLIVREVQPSNGGEPILLMLFTTLSGPVEEIVNLYGQRWNIETDLRSLKSQWCMEQLSCATPEMAAKEIEMGVAIYNLVRAVIAVAAEQSGLPPRSYSFTRAARIVESFAPKISSAKTQKEARQHFDRMMYFLKQAKLSRRKRKSYPREVWGKGAKFPNRKTRPQKSLWH